MSVTTSDTDTVSTLTDAQQLCHPTGISPAAGLFRFTDRKRYLHDYRQTAK
jgi:hypothetical protein